MIIPTKMFCAVVLTILMGQGETKVKKAEDYFLLCHRNDPNINKCIVNAIMDLKPRLVKGSADLNIPSMDPMFLPKLEMQEGEGNFQFRMTMKNVTMRGLKDFVITNQIYDQASNSFNLSMTVPKIDFDGYYEAKGRILLVPISGNGLVVFNFTKVTTKAYIPTHFEKKNGKIYLSVDAVNWSLDVEDGNASFSNLFDGDEQLGKALMTFLNENWHDAFQTYKYLPEQAFGAVFKELGNRIFSLFTYDELFLP